MQRKLFTNSAITWKKVTCRRIQHRAKIRVNFENIGIRILPIFDCDDILLTLRSLLCVCECSIPRCHWNWRKSWSPTPLCHKKLTNPFLSKFGDASSNSHFQSGYDPQFYDVVSYSHGAFPNGGRDDNRCEQCNRSFSDPIAKLQHLRYSSNHNICCSHDFSTPDDLRYHLINSPDHSYCEKCDEHFQEQGRGQRYWSHITNSPHAHHFCKSCQVELDTSELLNEHLADVHFCCVPCGVHCGTEEKLNVHKQVSGRHWICNQCLREFRGESQLIQHEKIHLEKNITCPRCHMGFCSNSALIIHW